LIVPMINVRHPKTASLIRKTSLHVDRNHSLERHPHMRMPPDAVLGDRLAATISLHDNKQLNIAQPSQGRHFAMKLGHFFPGG
jgi:hypothetical protein